LIPPAPELLGSFRLRRADCKKGCNDGRKYPVSSRREFLVRTASFTAGVRAVPGAVGSARTAPVLRATETATLSGAWLFRTDSHDRGTNENWFTTDPLAADWRKIDVPHTWQVEPSLAAFRGIAWYCRGFDAPERWAGLAIRIEFAAVFHTATVWVNGRLAGEHQRKGYTAFTFDISHLVRHGRPNTLVVRVDNSFNEHMLPRGRSRADRGHRGQLHRSLRAERESARQRRASHLVQERPGGDLPDESRGHPDGFLSVSTGVW